MGRARPSLIFYTLSTTLHKAIETMNTDSPSTSALLNLFLDRCRAELLPPAAPAPSRAGHKRPRPPDDAGSPVVPPPLPGKISALTARLVTSLETVGAPPSARTAEQQLLEEGLLQLLPVLAGALRHYVAGFLLPRNVHRSPPASDQPPHLPSLLSLQALGMATATVLARFPPRSQDEQQQQPPLPAPLQQDIVDPLVELLAALLALDRGTAGMAAEAAPLALTAHVASAISAAGDRCVHCSCVGWWMTKASLL